MYHLAHEDYSASIGSRLFGIKFDLEVLKMLITALMFAAELQFVEHLAVEIVTEGTVMTFEMKIE